MPSIDLNTNGRTYWRSLDELADTPEFRDFLANEFPNYSTAEMLLGSSSRRHFLKIMGASLALGGLVGCRRWPTRNVAPYASRPAGSMPGTTERYATALELCGVAKPLLVTAFDGRPIKIEGNPEHPQARGAADLLAQASILDLYDPQRSRAVVRRKDGVRQVATWDLFERSVAEDFGAAKQTQGHGLAVLSEASASPSVADMKERLLRAYPRATWTEYEPVSMHNQVQGARLAYGEPLRTQLHLENARVIVCLDADILSGHPNALRHARDWAVGRQSADQGHMNRMYVADGAPTLTGANADERLLVKPSRIAEIARALLAQIRDGHVELNDARQASFVRAVAADLQHNVGRSVVTAGANQPASVHAICCEINEVLRNVNATVSYTASGDIDSGPSALAALAESMRAGQVSTLLMIGGNPSYDAPVDADFATALAQVETSIHLSLHDNETSQSCTWHLPRAHYLEAWGDARAWDGTISVTQPLIEPLYGGRNTIELLATLLGEQVTNGHDIVRRTIAAYLPSASFETAWRRVIHDGFLLASKHQPVTPTLRAGQGESAATEVAAGFEIVFLPDNCVFDGRFANNGWLQELPDPLTKVTWDNPALIALSTAEELGIETGDMLRLTVGGRALEVAAFIMPGMAPDVVAVTLGYGREAAGHVGNGVGFNTYTMRTTDAPGFIGGVAVEKTGARYPLVTTQDHHAIDNGILKDRYLERIGDLVREADLATYQADPQFAHGGAHVDLSLQLFEEPTDLEEGHKWGMTIDLNKCTGCNACVIACQAENNIPIVGKKQIDRSREMHWIRIDRYFTGDEHNPQIAHQPVTCHHCDNAPCEQVCPVAATVHDSEGLNVMIYNRCIGTRYCSNNCPYKVRRFNFFDWHDRDPRLTTNDTPPHVDMPDTQLRDAYDPIRRLGFNPDVTMRMRGVMEKCTYCTQRIQSAKIEAKNAQARGERDEYQVNDGEITPACAQTCPTQAIVFGDLNDPNSRVRKLQQHNRAYAMLGELNVRPRTKYLAGVRNPNADATEQTTHQEPTEA